MPRRKRMRDSWGSITEVEKGKRYRIRWWGQDGNGVYRRMTCTVRGTRMDAEKRRSELMLDHSEDAPCPTVGQAWEKWALPMYERRRDDGEMSPNTFNQYMSGWGRYAKVRWGDVSCDSVKPLEVQQWLDEIPRNAAISALKVLRPTLDYAVRYGAIQTNPFREKYLLPSKKTIAAMDKGVWSLDELGYLWMHAACGKWWEATFLLSAFGGMRVGEALGIMKDDVSCMHVHGQELCIARVERQMPNRGSKITSRLKNSQSRRSVAIAGKAGMRLLELADSCDTWLGGDGLGNPSPQIRLAKDWRASLEEIDEGMRHPFRNLRNSYETNMRWSLKLPPWIVEPMLGHKSDGVTGEYYDRPRTEMFAEIIADAYASSRYDKGWEIGIRNHR